jgi:hypothetical protein
MWKHPGRTCGYTKRGSGVIRGVIRGVVKGHGGPGGSWKQREREIERERERHRERESFSFPGAFKIHTNL